MTMRYKKLIIPILLVAFILTACGNKADNEPTPEGVTDSPAAQISNPAGQSPAADTQTIDVPDAHDDDETPPASDLEAYCFKCITDDDTPVPGVRLQICTDETCMMQTSGEDGKVEFDGDPQQYSIHVYSFPKEYELVSDKEFVTADTYEEYYISFKRAGSE